MQNYGPTLVCPGLPVQNPNHLVVLGLLPGFKSIQIPGGADVQFNDKCLWNSSLFHQDEILSKQSCCLNKQCTGKNLKRLYWCLNLIGVNVRNTCFCV